MQTTQTVWSTRAPQKRRLFERCNSWVHAHLHSGNRTQTIVIRDVSRGGMKIEYAYGLMPGDKVAIELNPARTLEATVAWSVATYCGVEFLSPLDEADPALTFCKMH